MTLSKERISTIAPVIASGIVFIDFRARGKICTKYNGDDCGFNSVDIRLYFGQLPVLAIEPGKNGGDEYGRQDKAQSSND